MKKAQIAGEVFVYLMAAILFGLILLFGYRAIQSFIDRGQEVQIIQLKQELESTIKSIKSDPSTKQHIINLPSKFKGMCFLQNISNDAYKDNTCLCKKDYQPCPNPNTDFHPDICTAWKLGTKQNVFFIPNSDMETYVGAISLDNYYLCLEANNGKITLELKGMGQATRIKEWPKDS